MIYNLIGAEDAELDGANFGDLSRGVREAHIHDCGLTELKLGFASIELEFFFDFVRGFGWIQMFLVRLLIEWR